MYPRRAHGRSKLRPYESPRAARPSGVVNPRAIEALRERGIAMTGHRSKSLAELPAQTFDYVVIMSCGDAYRQVRDDIKRRVLALLQDAGLSRDIHGG